MIYQFKTSATMKEYNCRKWWIDSGIIREITVKADDLAQALKQYREIAKERYYIEISNNALKNKSPMYIDAISGEPQQVGYVITAKSDFQGDDHKWSTQYIDLWVTVNIVANPFENETNKKTQNIVKYINEYIKACEEVNDFENECYITAMRDILNFIERTEAQQ